MSEGWRLSDAGARAALAAVVGSLALAAGAVDLAGATGGGFWSDGATYYAAALSLAEDGDVRYEARDLERVRQEFSRGPGGLFLKRASGGLALDAACGFPWLRRVPADDPRLYYAKALAYPLAAAPFVKLLGAPRGLLVANVAFLGAALFLGYAELRRRSEPARALALVAVLFLGTAAPLYVVWMTPEAFNLGVVTAALVAWRRERPALAAVLLGLATYSKPTNLLLALPLGLEPALRAWGDRPAARARSLAVGKGLLEGARRGAILASVAAALFGLNAAATGEMNYQGGERKTFEGRYPFDPPGVSFDNAGFAMSTEHVGPLVEGRDDALRTARTGPTRTPSELRDSFLLNLGYFWIGRFGGAGPYFFPVVFGAALFLTRGPRDRPGWLALLALAVSYLFYIWLIPDNWYGGSGAIGNRYFPSLLPLAVVFVPRGREVLVAGAGALATAVFLSPLLLSPVEHSVRCWKHTLYPTFRIFPAELTMLNDLSISTPDRKKRPFGDTEGNPAEGRQADANAYYLYFLDDGTYLKESAFGGEGFWLRARSRAEVVVRALEPARRLTVRVTGGPAGDLVELGLGGDRIRLEVGAAESREASFEPGRGLEYYGTRLYLLGLRSRRGRLAVEPGTRRFRELGSFVQMRLEAEPRAASR